MTVMYNYKSILIIIAVDIQPIQNYNFLVFIWREIYNICMYNISSREYHFLMNSMCVYVLFKTAFIVYIG